MAQLPMYAAMINSPGTELAADINATDTEITVLDASKLPSAPNLVTVGGDETAETILYTGKTGNTLTGCTRGFEGTAKGWAAGSPAARNHTAYDYEAGRANIADLDERVDNIVIPDGTTTQKGIVQLSDATDGTRSTVAATEKAVSAAFQYGVERKAEVVAALNSIGVSASTSESWDSLIAKMSGVIRATGTAAVSQVLAGSTFSNASGNNRTGTMVNRGAVSQDITTQNGTYIIPQGYHIGTGSVRAVFANLIAANIRNGVNVGGVVGTLNEGIRYATGVSGFTSSASPFIKADGSQKNAYFLEVGGLAFKPKIIVITSQSTVAVDPGSGPYPQSTIYTELPTRKTNGYSTVTTGNGDIYYVDGTRAYVTSTGFLLPINVQFTNINLTWYAFDI